MPNGSCAVNPMENGCDRLDSMTARKLYGITREMSDNGRRLLAVYAWVQRSRVHSRLWHLNAQ
ncbi:hypothetical protein BOTBODRAFT_35890 [Botryobasidium botryosum FD-172 SS1]|uniref:Uncharacterized protein n=1 Tax=Botryobasidium botryosum (strain FD-172 SS1) TaxID=930990 RepID=A0A067M7U5_BOTB1|nr:hypothetical protein BOTBODRAFT_35890 [Botryobasidium botryosum FD-172 SS1]